jgi:hypothetical protein
MSHIEMVELITPDRIILTLHAEKGASCREAFTVYRCKINSQSRKAECPFFDGKGPPRNVAFDFAAPMITLSVSCQASRDFIGPCVTQAI